MKKIFKVGIAGYGIVGRRRRQLIDLNENFITTAVCDISFKDLEQLPDGVKCFSTYRELLGTDIDVLFVCLPNYLASEVTCAGLNNGLHVFCEKPPGRSVEDIRNVRITELKYPNLRLKYGFNHRYHDSVRKALEIVKSNRFGRIINVRGVYGKSKVVPFAGGWRAERELSGGGILLDQGIHMVDLMRLFCGEFYDVKSFVSNSYWSHNVEDNAYAIMKSESGCVGVLHSSATQWQHRFSLEIAMYDGAIELQGILTGSKSYGQEKLIIVPRDEKDTGASKEEVVTYLEDNSWRDEINEFAESIVSGVPVEVGSSLDALNTMALVYRIFYADQNWRDSFNIQNPDVLLNDWC